MIPLWMALQLIPLALAAGRVPLSARFPQPAERLAAGEMLAVQIAAAGLLFPMLLKSWNRFSLATLGMWPILYLAGTLAGNSGNQILSAGGYVTAWLLTLTLWRQCLHRFEAQKIAVMIASLWTIGGQVLLYLRLEYGADQSHLALWHAAAGPIWAALNRLENPAVFEINDIPLLCLFIAGSIYLAIRSSTSHKTRAKLSTEL